MILVTTASWVSQRSLSSLLLILTNEKKVLVSVLTNERRVLPGHDGADPREPQHPAPLPGLHHQLVEAVAAVAHLRQDPDHPRRHEGRVCLPALLLSEDRRHPP